VKALALGVVLAAGCSIPQQSLRTLTIPPSGASLTPSDKSFLIYPFEDQRGEEAGSLPFIDFVPLVDLFYSHVFIRYPDSSGLLRGKVDGKSVIATGALPEALPYMLGNLFRQMGFAPAWAPVGGVDPQRDLKTFDYVVRGKLRMTRLHLAGNFLPLGILGLLGMPCIFIDYRLEYDVIVLKNQPEGGEVMRKSYDWEGKKVIGLYWRLTASYDLFVEALNQTLPRVVADIANAVHP
jgi:hypothetical protein